MADGAGTNKVEYKPVVIEQFNEVVNAFAAGRCDVFTTDVSGLASIRISKLTKPDDYQVLPEIISKEPLGPFVRQGDRSEERLGGKEWVSTGRSRWLAYH